MPARPQLQLVKLLHIRPRKQRIPQTVHPVLLPEIQPKRLLRMVNRCIPPVHPQPNVLLKLLRPSRIQRIEILHRRPNLRRRNPPIRINPRLKRKQIIRLRRKTHHRQRPAQRRHHQRRIRRIPSHLRIHPVIRCHHRPSERPRSVIILIPPRRRKPSRCRRLPHHLHRKNIRVRLHRRRRPALAKRRRPQHRRPANH